MFPFWLPTAILWVMLVGWDLNLWLTDFAYEFAFLGFALIAIVFSLPIIAAETRVRRELLRGYCTTRPLHIEFNVALSSFAYVDEITGIVLARCDQIPVNGEGLIGLKETVRQPSLNATTTSLIHLPRYNWKILSPTFDWELVSRPLYLDYLSKKSVMGAVESLKRIRPVSEEKTF
jgi:hypothetical protein